MKAGLGLVFIFCGLSSFLAAPAMAHGNETSLDSLFERWSLEPVPIVFAAIALALYLRAFTRLRGRGRRDLAERWRLGVFALALVLALVAVSSPLDAVGEGYLLSGHMLQHVLLADVAPALGVLALRGPMHLFLLPGMLLRGLAGQETLRALARFLLRPEVSVALWAVSLVVWHVPRFYDAALGSRGLHDLEHGSFVLGGTLVWVLLLDPRRSHSAARRLLFVVVIYAVGEALAYALMLGFSPYYPTYAAQDERLFGLTPLLDQKLAGVVMMVEQTMTLGLCALWLTLEHRKERQSVGDRSRRLLTGDKHPAS